MKRTIRTVTDKKISVGESFVLSRSESHHLLEVLRIKPNSYITVRSCEGKQFLCTFKDVRNNLMRLFVVEEIINMKKKVETTVATAIPKGKRADFLIEKLSELQVSEIIPLICKRSIVIPDPSHSQKIKRWQRITQESFKQSGSSIYTVVRDFKYFDDAVMLLKNHDLKLVAHPYYDSLNVRKVLEGTNKLEISKIAILVGPEGGFTEREVEHAVANGFTKVLLTDNTLRIETAALFITSFVYLFFSDTAS